MWRRRTEGALPPDISELLHHLAPPLRARPDVARLRFSTARVQTCNLSVAFGAQLFAPCLPRPRSADWLAMLKGRVVGFVGDSVLRDLFIHVSLAMAPAARKSVRTYGIGRAHFGTTVGAGAFAEVSFEDGATLRWCFHLDDHCIHRHMLPRAPRMKARSAMPIDVLIAGFGAHCVPMLEHCESSLHGWPFSDPRSNSGNINRSSHAPRPASQQQHVFGELFSRMHLARRAIWMEYSPPHFPWGLGEFEDRWMLRRAATATAPLATISDDEAARPRAARPAALKPTYTGPNVVAPGHDPGIFGRGQGRGRCRQLGSCVSALSLWRLGLRSHFAARGVPILPVWDAAIGAHELHPDTDGFTVLAIGAPRGLRSGPDCRHFCNPSTLVRHWGRALYAMLTPPQAAHLPECTAERVQRLRKAAKNRLAPRQAQQLEPCLVSASEGATIGVFLDTSAALETLQAHKHPVLRVDASCAGNKSGEDAQRSDRCSCLHLCHAQCERRSRPKDRPRWSAACRRDCVFTTGETQSWAWRTAEELSRRFSCK